MNATGLTIGRLARAADVGVETIRYYQRLDLLPTPETGAGAFRIYPRELIDRIRFIKRAQELGFSLAEVETLLRLDDGAHRKQIRKLAADRLEQIRTKLADLRRMEKTLVHLIHECDTTGQSHACPIIAALMGKHGDVSEAPSESAASRHRPRR